MEKTKNGLERFQHTLQKAVSYKGTGLHTGKEVKIIIEPAPADSGICFERVDLPEKPVIPAYYEAVADTMLATTLSLGRTQMKTVEHLLAAFCGMDIDNARIIVNLDEIPLADGSAGPFVELLKDAGRVQQNAPRRYLRVTKACSYTDGAKSITIEPGENFQITSRISFDAKIIGNQKFSAVIDSATFMREIAWARTFGSMKDLEALRTRENRALGASLDNTIAINKEGTGVLNKDGLRSSDEFVRHKMLDLIGDVALAGVPILGHITANCSGHSLHHKFLRILFSRPDCWEYVSSERLN